MNKLFTCLFFLVFSLGMAQEKPTQFTLQEAIDYTLTHNYDVLIADNEIKKAEKKIWETTAAGLPQIDGTVDYNYNIDRAKIFLGDSIEFEAGQQKTLTATGQATQLIFSGSYLVGLQSAKAFKKISVMSKEKAESELTEAVIMAYSSVVVADENIEILNKNLKTAEKNLHDITEIYKVGLGDEQSVDQMSYNLLSLKSAKDFAVRQRQNALNSLKYIMGLKQSDPLVLVTEMKDMVEEDLLLPENQQLDAQAVENHIDYQIAEHQIAINELQVKYQKTMALPTLSTFYRYSFNWSTNDESLFNNFGESFPSSIWGLQLQIPIFSSLKRSAITQQAQIDLENAELERQKTEQRLKQELNNSYLSLQSAVDRYHTNLERVKLTRKIYGKEQIKYFEGLSSNMDLSNTELQMYEAESEFISSAFDLISAKTAFYQAIGKF